MAYEEINDIEVVEAGYECGYGVFLYWDDKMAGLVCPTDGRDSCWESIAEAREFAEALPYVGGTRLVIKEW